MLILSRGGKATKLEPQAFADEAALQRYLAAFPQAIPLSDSDNPPKLHVLGREFPTGSGPIDILGTDETGAAYIIETKLYKNPDKRLVIAQVLDYGASLWAAEPDTTSILASLRQGASWMGPADPLTALAGFLNADEETALRHLERTRDALADGRFTAIILMDRLSDRLRDLVLFMNENSRFRVLAVELDYYVHDEIEVVNPRLFGTETRRPASATRRSRSQTVEPEVFLAEYAEKAGGDAVEAWSQITKILLASALPGIRLVHRPGGVPILTLPATAIGAVQLFVLGGVGEIRDMLHKNPAFETDPLAAAARTELRTRLLNAVAGAVVGGDAGRLYMPLAAFEKALPAVLPSLLAFASSLEAVQPPIDGA